MSDDGLDADVSPVDDANDALRRVVLAAQELRAAFAQALGVGVSDTIVLSQLASRGPLTATTLSARTGLQKSSITALLDRLERKQLVQRRPVDRRSAQVELTASGRDALRSWSERSHAALDEAARSAGGPQQLVVTLNALADALGVHHAVAGGAGSSHRTDGAATGVRQRRTGAVRGPEIS